MRRWWKWVVGGGANGKRRDLVGVSVKKVSRSKVKNYYLPTKVLEIRPTEGLVTVPVKRVGTSARGPAAPWPWPSEGVRAARLRRGALGIPFGSARTVGARFIDFLTA
jgi:hypothetical protein